MKVLALVKTEEKAILALNEGRISYVEVCRGKVRW